MASAEMKFTKGALGDAAHMGRQATRYRDPSYPNLYVEVSARSKTLRFRRFWKSQNLTETLGTWPQMSVVEAAQEAAERHVTQALDPRQRKVSTETAAGYATKALLHKSADGRTFPIP